MIYFFITYMAFLLLGALLFWWETHQAITSNEGRQHGTITPPPPPPPHRVSGSNCKALPAQHTPPHIYGVWLLISGKYKQWARKRHIRHVSP